MTRPRITLELAVPEVNLVLNALGRLPYRDVYALIESIHAQAGEQLGADADAPAADAPS